ncbi:MAG: bifunctional GTP diphosphokinase/guanosine-3',5'-bis pyrophosphate 3'-pyrophosphohydrolase [Gammaproteobacteria bacterium]|nr:bifunctional GTP diphosphokinase/guanosine-3',5'-bis pyrophosphate 3'-pyrophosphohydrolase [Gammaproteobacteria bacterium]MCB1849693.1 bifunctional GTP diphosphokinase/guanosine-3',5'-bis pyrophosphate 3'-pyrophosphohydrolase [Gammaproteobacteria bacterium]MCP5415884.1 bifunctional GTP diphosphokinase/guanosine-3',5'-bis pyrophosphate 3'-pyrophosphohydrolase [Chromatiaceae bacterium]
MPPVTADLMTLHSHPGKPRFLISDLCVALESYLTPAQIQEVYRAYMFSAEAHEGQQRMTGEPYIYHPLAVARILANIQMDYKCLMAAILHDVIEDTHISKAQIAEAFDEEIAQLVDGVSKLTQIDFRSRREAQAANFRKMLLAMTRDIRVIMIKLADRLHNMRTLGVMRPEKRRRIARETLDIYVPIANRLGINSVRTELEELGFAAYWPMRYRVLRNAVKQARGNRKRVLGSIEAAISARLADDGFKAEVKGREKHTYSIYKKMRQKKLSFSEVADVYAFRVIVDQTDTCYRVLGAVHNLYKPVAGRFKDYIAIPKVNGYQSLHTVLFGPHGIPIEIQIRTEEMHRVAESGIAAHWLYKAAKEEDNLSQVAVSDWMKHLLDLQQGAGDSVEFLDHVKVDLFPEEVYVFTPRGKILVLAKGSTVIDFAYAVHTDVGNSCVAARIDRRMVPLRTQLVSGQTVEIICSETAAPKAAWLNFVVTGKARVNIRSYLKNLQKQEAIALGGRLLEKELNVLGETLERIPEKRVSQLLTDFRLRDKEMLLMEIGLGNRMPLLVARQLLEEIGRGNGEAQESKKSGKKRSLKEREGKQSRPLIITGTEGMVVKFAKCCRPIPGDNAIANFSPGKGVVVHRQECRNIGELRKQESDWIYVQWEATQTNTFSTEIKVETDNRRGVLATIAAAISEMGSNIENVSMDVQDGATSSLKFVLAVEDRRHLAGIIRRVRSLPHVLRISRTMQ